MTSKKTLFKNISIFLCLVPMLLLSLFCLVPKRDVKNVYGADNVVENYNFIGSNLTFLTSSLRNGTTFDRYMFANLTFTFSLNDGVYSAGVTGSTNHPTLNSTTSTIIALNPFSVSNLGFGSNSYYTSLSSDTSYRMYFDITRYGNIGPDVTRVRFYSVSNASGIFNHVCYYDASGNYIDFSIWCVNMSSNTSTLATSFAFVDRTYYINIVFSDNTYYESGYINGYNDGVADGSSSGYQDGYSAGQTIGYENGYSAGLVAGGDHTFMSLIGAVIDVPVSAFTSLLNFEILGVNILGFITGLLTIAIIIFIIKLCMGGK